MTQQKVVLVTGGSRRIGAGIVEMLHHKGMNIILHYRHSEKDAAALSTKLNHIRPNSVVTLPLDLSDIAAIDDFIAKAKSIWGDIDVLVNNASSYYETPIGTVTMDHWNDLFSSNLTAPFFLSQAIAPSLAKRHGCIINIIDINAERPAKNYPVYCIAKAGLWMMTKTLAKELSPDIRVNAISPGTMVRPENDTTSDEDYAIKVSKIPLKRIGESDDIANAVYFLIEHSPYITGQLIAVDGGRSLHSDSDD